MNRRAFLLGAAAVPVAAAIPAAPGLRVVADGNSLIEGVNFGIKGMRGAEYYAADGIHLSTAGHQLVARSIRECFTHYSTSPGPGDLAQWVERLSAGPIDDGAKR